MPDEVCCVEDDPRWHCGNGRRRQGFNSGHRRISTGPDGPEKDIMAVLQLPLCERPRETDVGAGCEIPVAWWVD